MDEDERAYYARRADEERARARLANSPAAALVHHAIADECRKRCGPLLTAVDTP